MTFEEELDMLRDMWVEARKFQKKLDVYLILLGKQIAQVDRVDKEETKQRG